MPLVLVSEFLERLDRDEAKTRLVNYCFMVRDTLQDSKLEQRYKAAQQEKIEFCLQSTLELLSSPSSVFATAEDLWGMKKELEEVLAPFMLEVYEAADAGGVPEAATPEAPSHEAAESGEVPEATTPGSHD